MRLIFPQVMVLLLSIGACTDPMDDEDELVPPPSMQEVELELEPPPGAYAAFRLSVTVTTDPDYELFFALDEAPEIIDGQGYVNRLTVELVKTARLFVSVRSPDGDVSGPYEFQYGLTPLANAGACRISPPRRMYFREDESLELMVHYVLPASLAQLEVSVNGTWEEVELDHHRGSMRRSFGPFVEGEYAVNCRVVLLDDVWPGEPVSFTVDGTPPTGHWLTENFTFDPYTWRNAVHAAGADALSGLASIGFCNAHTHACIPMTERGAGVFRFATALDTDTDFVTPVYVRLEDHAGNVTRLPEKTMDFSAFADPLPQRRIESMKPITFTTDKELDLSHIVPESISEVWRHDQGLVEADPSRLPLWSGWNEFLYRIAGTGHWKSYAIYRAGLEVDFPPTDPEFPDAQWIVFSSPSTIPAMQAALQTIQEGNTRWFRPWFDRVPTLFFVEDLEGDGRWTEQGALYLEPDAPLPGSDRARGEPVRIEDLESVHVPDMPDASLQATVSRAEGLPEGDLYFQWRESLNAFPSYHGRSGSWSMDEYPIAVSVPAAGICIFFLDVYDQGTLSSDEPRAWGECSEKTFDIDRRREELAVQSLFNFSQPWVVGIPYGRVVTAAITVGPSQDPLLAGYPTHPVRDNSGLGQAMYGEGFERRFPHLPATIYFYDEGRSAGWALDAEQAPVPEQTIDVLVVDENEGFQRALVVQERQEHTNAVIAEKGELTPLPVTGTQPYTVFARKDGWLSQKAVTDGTSVNLRLLSTQVSGRITGFVTREGEGIPNAELVWDNAGYFASTRSGQDGSYALPASGGSGNLSVSVYDMSRKRTLGYDLHITAESRTMNVTLPTEPVLTWPAGMHRGAVPDSITGPEPVVLEAGDLQYGAVLTEAVEGIFSANWPILRRIFPLDGALPAFPEVHWEWNDLPPFQGALRLLESYARCGDWEQAAQGFILVSVPCWTWHAGDGLQTYALGRQLDGMYPDVVGLGVLEATVTRFHGEEISVAQVLSLHDRILVGREIQVELPADGIIRAAVPFGLYEVRDQNGEPLRMGTRTAVLSVLPDHTESYALRLPPE